MIHEIYDIGVVIQCNIPFAAYNITEITIYNKEIKARVEHPNKRLVGVLRITEDGLLINCAKPFYELIIYATLVDENSTFNLDYLHKELLKEFEKNLATPLYEDLKETLDKMGNISLITLDTYKLKDIKALVEQCYILIVTRLKNKHTGTPKERAEALGNLNRFFKELQKF